MNRGRARSWLFGYLNEQGLTAGERELVAWALRQLNHEDADTLLGVYGSSRSADVDWEAEQRAVEHFAAELELVGAR